MLNIIIAGLPGSGKGTQAKKIHHERDKSTYIEMGDMLRDIQKDISELAREIQSYLEEGALVPDQYVNQVVSKAIQENIKDSSGFIFDGYPRTVDQAKFLDEELAYYKTEVSQFIYLSVEDKTLIERMKSRGREDDREELLEKRIETQRINLRPIKEHYQAQGKFYQVDGGRNVDEINDEIKNLLVA